MAHLTEQVILKYLERTLGPQERCATSEHLAHCPACRVRVMREPAFQRRVTFAIEGLSQSHSVPRLRIPWLRRPGMERLKADIRRRLDPSAGDRSLRNAPGDLSSDLKRNEWPPRTGGWFAWFRKPVVLAGAAAAVIFLTFFIARTSLQPAKVSETIRDGAFRFQIRANQEILGAAGVPKPLVDELSTGLQALNAASRTKTGNDTTRGLAESFGPGLSDSEKVTPIDQNSFSKEVFGQALTLPRATSDPDAHPNGIVVTEAQPVLTWRKIVNAALSLKIVNCRTGQEVFSTGLSADQTALKVPRPLEREAIYLWQITALNRSIRPEVVTEARFKLANIQPNKNPSRLIEAIHQAKAGLFREAEATLLEVAQSNPNSTTVGRVLSYVRQLEGKS